MSRPLVSIVTPTLNQGRFIEQTIRSVRAQGYDHFEHIVIDGGSTDETLDILRRYEGTYPMRWISEPDEGMYDAINKGMRQAKGDILAYLNSDDLYFPWTLEVVVEAFEREPGADLIFGDALAVDDGSGTQLAYLFPPFRLDHMRSVGLIAQPAVFWRARVVEQEGFFDDTLRYVADCDYWMRAGMRHRFRKVDEFLAVERDHAETLRQATEGRVWEELEAVRRRYGESPVGLQRRTLVLWSRMWFRWNWLRLLWASSGLQDRRHAPWRRYLESGHVSVSRSGGLMVLVPRIGRRFMDGVLRPSRYWLEPPA